MKKFWWVVVIALIALASLLISCQGAVGTEGKQGPPGPQGTQGTPAPLPLGPGIKATITKVEIGADRKPVVTFTITNDKGLPLKISDLDTYPSFILSYVKEDPTTKLTQYVAYTMSDVKGAPYTFKGKKVEPVLTEVKGRPGNDPKATTPTFPADHPAFKDLGNGTFTYTFSTVLPENYDRNATHRIGGQITRATRAFVANPTLDFVPAGGEVELTRQIVTTASCNQCHDPLAAHGGSRRDPALCVTCHTSQTIDPETGNTVEFKVMTHKIHRGENLPSVQNKKDYVIVGYQQTVFDAGTIVWPQFGGDSGGTIGDVRTCTTCHGAPPVGMKTEDYAKLAPNADNYKTKPSAAACGACHDNINFATGKALYGGRDHPGGAQKDDSACAACHVADSGKEFDASVVGAHTIPTQSKQLKGLKVEIIRVAGTERGLFPNITFSAKDNDGKAVPLADLTAITFNLAGPTTDYVNYRTESANLTKVVSAGDGIYGYTLSQSIPATATGTYAIGIEATRPETITGNNGKPLTVNVRPYNPVFYIPVTDKVAVPRRQVVSTEKCNVCHNEIAFHGGGRLNAGEYCQFCHNPAVLDVPASVPATFGGPYDVPRQSISLQLMIHRIHTGEELTRDFTIYRSRGVFNFNEVRFPGDRTNCATCHVGNSYTLPLPETTANTQAPREFYSPLGPAASACLGCHDSKTAGVHAATQTTSYGEACAACHGRDAEFAVEKVH